jgi:hypothetical protein
MSENSSRSSECPFERLDGRPILYPSRLTRQGIDAEILGNRPDHLLVKVFYNPGTDGARFDYGYRGTPVIIEFGFDAPSRDLGSDPDPSPTDEPAREYLANSLTATGICYALSGEMVRNVMIPSFTTRANLVCGMPLPRAKGKYRASR